MRTRRTESTGSLARRLARLTESNGSLARRLARLTESNGSLARRLARLTSPWAVLLAGPVIGTVYFFVVYLLAEAGCADDLDLVDVTLLRVVILALGVASVVAFVSYAGRARALRHSDTAGQQGENERFMATTGLVILGLFVLFVLFVAAPAIGSSLC